MMRNTIEAEVDDQGIIRLKEALALPPGSRVLITLIEPEGTETALPSDVALGEDWNRPEEDAAWSDLARA